MLMLTDWEIWLDNNISSIIGKWLKDEFNLQVKSSFVLQTKTLSDLEIYNKAKQAGNVIIISKDSDMVDIVALFGSPPKLINIRNGNCGNRQLYNVLASYIETALRLLIDFDKHIFHVEITL